MKKTLRAGLLALAGNVALVAGVAAADTMQTETMSQDAMAPEVMHLGEGMAADGDPRLYVPDVNYREEWVQLGSFSVLADDPEEGAKELHVVYTDRAAIKAYLENGSFPDGAKIVKDVYATRTEDLTTGRASYADTLAGRFVMVKDAENRNADSSPLWGEGWGWAFYEGTETRKTVTTDYVADCMGCHAPAAETDFLYVRGYPLLAR
ncbi:MAG: cytochrome P460 family protein [Parvibaculaceae bacterium]